MDLSLFGNLNILKKLDLEELHDWLLKKELDVCFKDHFLEQSIKEQTLLSLLEPVDSFIEIKDEEIEEAVYGIKEGSLCGVPSNKMNLKTGKKRKHFE